MINAGSFDGVVEQTAALGIDTSSLVAVNGCATEYMGNLLSATAAYVIVYVFLTVVAVTLILIIRKLLKIGNWLPIMQKR